MNLTYNTLQLEEANVEIVIHNVEGDVKIDIIMTWTSKPLIAMDKKYKRVQVLLCQYMEPLG